MKILILPMLVLFGFPAHAASSAWHEVEGGAIRIVTEEAPSDGLLRGALEIRLEPGWKTYWMDPGETGVPPQVELTGIDAPLPVKIRFPPPKWIDDGYAIWAGYDRSTVLALELPPVSPHGLTANVFLGICKSICIPVDAQLAVRSAAGSDLREIGALQAAFDRLPAEADGSFGIVGMQLDAGKDRMLARIALPAEAEAAELFLADGGGWKFGRPVPLPGESNLLAIPVQARPEQAMLVALAYTLVSGGKAVEGEVEVGGENSE